MQTSISNKITQKNWEKELLTLNDYNSINTIYGYFQIVYKHIHWINLYNSKAIKGIDSKIRFVYNHFFPNDKNNDSKSMIESLKTLEKSTYDEISHEIIKKILLWRNKDIECYRQIKLIVDEINKTKLKFKQILNRESNLEQAYKIYVENNGEITRDVLYEVAKNEFQNNTKQRQTQRQIENIIQNKSAKSKPKKEKTDKWENWDQKQIETQKLSKNEKILRRIQNKIKILEFNISNQLWNKLFDDFIVQLNWLINFSLKWWEQVIIQWKKWIDPRYKTFTHAATNKQAAIAFIQQFLYENKPKDINIKWLRFFSYNTTEEEQKYLENEDITEDIAELFIKKIELIKFQDKNT